MRRFPARLASFSPEVEEERREAKSFLYEALYNCKPLEREKRQAEKVVSEVFDHLVAHPEALPCSYRERCESEKVVRVVCDYIAGMTDHYVEDLRTKMVSDKKMGRLGSGDNFIA